MLVHEIYRMYDNQVRKAKEDAQKARDTVLNRIAEEMVKA